MAPRSRAGSAQPSNGPGDRAEPERSGDSQPPGCPEGGRQPGNSAEMIVCARQRANQVGGSPTRPAIPGRYPKVGVTAHWPGTADKEDLGFKIKRGERRLELRAERIKSGARRGAVYRYPTQKSLDSFKDKIRNMTRRSNGLSTRQLIERINPVLRGWGNYYRIGNVRKLFNRLGRWIVRRIWSHRKKRWRNSGWRELPEPRLYGEYGLVNLVDLIAGIRARGKAPKLL